MILKNRLSLPQPFPTWVGLALSLLLVVASPAWAGDYCTDIPTCSDGEVLVLTKEDEREDCAMLLCAKPAMADSLGTRVTPEILARFKNPPLITCEEGKTALKLKVIPEGHENAWICANSMLANYYKNNDMVADNMEADDATTNLTCEDNRRLVHYKTKPKNAETAWACVHPMAYKVLKKQGRLVED